MKNKILVVDDEEVARRSLADILRLEGYAVQAAAGGEQAIDALKQETFDLMLLDLKMPGVDGLEVLQAASRISPDTVVIMLTAHGSMESAIAALRLAAHDYLLKPSSPEQILESVRRALVRHGDVLRKRSLLEQMDSSLKELRAVERRDAQLFTESHPVTLDNGVKVDLARREVWQDLPGGLRVALTPTEGRLFKVLLENHHQVLTHRELVLQVQGYEVTDWEAPEVLRPLVSRLRQKLSQFPGGAHWIKNVRGTGYVLEV